MLSRNPHTFLLFKASVDRHFDSSIHLTNKKKVFKESLFTAMPHNKYDMFRSSRVIEVWTCNIFMNINKVMNEWQLRKKNVIRLNIVLVIVARGFASEVSMEKESVNRNRLKINGTALLCMRFILWMFCPVNGSQTGSLTLVSVLKLTYLATNTKRSRQEHIGGDGDVDVRYENEHVDI